MNKEFENLPWHDAIIEHIYIDRQNPGERDTVKIFINWPDDVNSSIIEFIDCYSLTLNMNFGIVAAESILSAECIQDCTEVQNIVDAWGKAGVDICDLNCYRIETNSTNSEIAIFAMDFKITSIAENQ